MGSRVQGKIFSHMECLYIGLISCHLSDIIFCLGEVFLIQGPLILFFYLSFYRLLILMFLEISISNHKWKKVARFQGDGRISISMSL